MVISQGFIVGPAIAMGIILGIYEAFLVHGDEGNIRGSWGHAIHTIPSTFIFVFLAMNVTFVLQFLPQNVAFFKSAAFPHVLRALIGIIAMIKLHAVSAIAPNVKGMAEKWSHSFIIAGLIVASPYLWELFIAKMVPDNIMKFLVFGGK
ncbi:MAG: hypothetical protein WC755_01610 [Candidatus Woesearchaeota archaeon]|jgi:hypothetical protein